MITIGVKRKKSAIPELAAKVTAASEMIVQDIAKDFCEDVKDTITNNLTDGPALAPITIARKGHATKLLETGDLRAAVQVQGKGIDVYVGVPRSSSEYQKARIHEFGAPDMNIPKRSFIHSTWNRRRDVLLAKARVEFMAAI